MGNIFSSEINLTYICANFMILMNIVFSLDTFFYMFFKLLSNSSTAKWYK